MTTHEPGSQFLGALLVLTAVARELQRAGRYPLPAPPFEALQGSISRLTHSKGASPLPCPERFRQAWLRWRSDRRRGLEAHVIRHLCWDADVATDVRFQDYLDRHQVVLGPRSLQGLVRACHARWCKELAEGSVVRAVRRRVEGYEGNHSLLLHWKTTLPMLLGPQGPGELANTMLQRLSPIKAWCESWGVDEPSPYVQESVRHAARECRAQLARSGHSAQLTQYLLRELLPWTGWRLEDFQAECAALILHPQASSVWEPLTHLVLSDSRLGDPRLPGNEERWAGMPAVVRQRVIQWLSRAAREPGS